MLHVYFGMLNNQEHWYTSRKRIESYGKTQINFGFEWDKRPCEQTWILEQNIQWLWKKLNSKNDWGQEVEI